MAHILSSPSHSSNCFGRLWCWYTCHSKNWKCRLHSEFAFHNHGVWRGKTFAVFWPLYSVSLFFPPTNTLNCCFEDCLGWCSLCLFLLSSSSSLPAVFELVYCWEIMERFGKYCRRQEQPPLCWLHFIFILHLVAFWPLSSFGASSQLQLHLCCLSMVMVTILNVCGMSGNGCKRRSRRRASNWGGSIVAGVFNDGRFLRGIASIP